MNAIVDPAIGQRSEFGTRDQLEHEGANEEHGAREHPLGSLLSEAVALPRTHADPDHGLRDDAA